jgi:hypothetical protein
MNRPFLDRAEVFRAALRSCSGYRRRAFEFRRWAKEAEETGNLDDYRKWMAEAKRADTLKWSSFATAVAYHA